MLTLNHRIKDLYLNPVGKDVIDKLMLQMGRSIKLIDNPIIGNIKLKDLPRLTLGRIDEAVLLSLIELFNSEPDLPANYNGPVTKTWWKEAIFYQIYPRSFKDSNGDGIGDLRGIINKLDYLERLGVDTIWLSPIYDSPNDDNGYDIRDYTRIMAEFGTMADFEELMQELHSRGMRLIMDLVVNHTSDEHEWFQRAISDPSSKYRDYYIFRDEPNNWTSFFGGSAWKFIEKRNQYALHLFTKKQMDLNWDNPSVREDVINMVKSWLEKGVDGFRLDVINYISKREGLPEGNKLVGDLIGFYGIEHYFYGPNLHRYLRELREKAFEPYGAFSVGETPGIGLETGKLLTAESRRELDMIFSFDHLENPGKIRLDDYRYDLNYYKNHMIQRLKSIPNDCRMSIYYENHDNPRMISKVDPDPLYRPVLAKLLAVMQLTLKGTPFLYQGQELGMVNQNFTSMDQLRDVESLNYYSEQIKEMKEGEAFQKVLSGTRDHARTPVQWSSAKYGGFSTDEPWIIPDDDYVKWNAKDQATDPDSVLNFYRQLIKLRKEHQSLIYGEIKITNKKTQNLFTYYRMLEGEILFIECNLSRSSIKRKKPPHGLILVMSNYTDPPKDILRPYEALVWRVR